jgi:predicted nucleic acid-binding protein
MKDPSLKSEQASNWVRYLVLKNAFVISVQVMSELANVALKKSHLFGHDNLRSALANLIPFCRAPLDPEILMKACDLQIGYRLSWFDSLLLSSALGAQCQYFLSEDLNHLQQVETLTIINPFRLAPEDF